MSGGGDQDDGYIAKLRGLPWSATTDDIITFFKDCNIKGGKNGIHMTTSREGRPSGEAFVEFVDVEDLQRALLRDRDHMGNRYIEVFKVNRAEMEWVIKRCGPMYGSNEDGCVRLRGLPFGCSKEEIAQFFTGLEIVPNGITLLTDYSGRSSGEAYVQFVNKEVAEKALLKHRERIGHRYIEIFRSSLSEVSSVLGYNGRRIGGGPGGMGYNSRPSPYDRGDHRYGGMNRFQSRGSRSFKGGFSNSIVSDRKFNDYDVPNSPWMGASRNGSLAGSDRSPYSMSSWNGSNDRGVSAGIHCVHMRGLPFKATQMDIADFFKPIIPVSIRLLQDGSGRASGEADVEFASHEDAVRAMSKDKGHMQHRYIELFLNSSASNGPPSSGGCYGGLGRRRP
ncbi:heterogeneous nuclear ribonucleoprotein H-like isoform X2 [Agrilus planipennis]|uniref:Heterogeneous nuclear ribonucleoprotein H-like isoform X2 n=1 Tax=Agrilus planipennis TaxID=224129 RepID=A0A1W4X712_AGRPL|nr:heterogeneous nuclear ribonucleoprotein H-like isoform X2 [Agrilus planipennis]